MHLDYLPSPIPASFPAGPGPSRDDFAIHQQHQHPAHAHAHGHHPQLQQHHDPFNHNLPPPHHHHPHHLNHGYRGSTSAPAHMVFSNAGTDIDVDISPITSPWLGADSHPPSVHPGQPGPHPPTTMSPLAQPQRSNKRAASPSNGDSLMDGGTSAMSRKSKQSPAIRASNPNSNNMNSTPTDSPHLPPSASASLTSSTSSSTRVKRSSVSGRSASAASTPLLRGSGSMSTRSRKGIGNGGGGGGTPSNHNAGVGLDTSTDSPSPVDLGMGMGVPSTGMEMGPPPVPASVMQGNMGMSPLGGMNGMETFQFGEQHQHQQQHVPSQGIEQAHQQQIKPVTPAMMMNIGTSRTKDGDSQTNSPNTTRSLRNKTIAPAPASTSSGSAASTAKLRSSSKKAANGASPALKAILPGKLSFYPVNYQK
jgi:hypothetical protein